jgi:hypothetical protein
MHSYTCTHLRIGIDMFVCVVLFGLFAKLQKVALSFIVVGCLSVCTEQLGSDWMDFLQSLYLRAFRICATKIQVLLKSDENNGNFMWRLLYIYDYIWLKSLKKRYVPGKSYSENQNMHFMFDNPPPRNVPLL